MNYKNQDITKRAQESPLWGELEKQRGHTLPFLLERYLLLENWKRSNRGGGEEPSFMFDAVEIAYLHRLLANAATVLLGQEERIRELEAQVNFKIGS